MSGQQQDRWGVPSHACLRSWTADDADVQAVLRAFDAPDMTGQSSAPITTAAEARDWIAPLVPDPLEPEPRTVAFALELEGKPVGNVMVSAIDRRHLTGWMSYWVAPGARGRGLAGAAAAALAGHCFTVLGLERVELGHRLNNPASGRVAAAAGFAREGIERQKLRYQDDDGTWQRFDTALWARLATDPVPDLIALACR